MRLTPSQIGQIMEPETTKVHPAYTLKQGDRIKLAGAEFTLRNVVQTDDWVELIFTTQMWDPITEKWTQRFGCHYGFCVEVLEK